MKRIVIEFKPSLDLRKPEEAALHIEGFRDMLDALTALQNAQSELIGQMAQQREAALAAAQLAQAQRNGVYVERH